MKRLASLVLALALMVAAPPSLAVDLVSHRAVYRLTLGDSALGVDVTDVEGAMIYEWGDSCDGWTTTQKSRMKFFYQDGRAADIGWTLSSWESKDGLRYRFFVRNFQGNKLTTELKGKARLNGTGKGGVAEFSEPKAMKLALPSGTLFPTSHSRSLLQHLAAGDRAFYATVFDGTDDQGMFDINAVLAGRPIPDADAAKLSPLLAKGPVYRLGLAFYPAGKDTPTPEHEQRLTVYGNGIVDRLTLEYGQFTVDAALQKLEALPAPGC
jgi:EipB-like